jgi:hypothetical protein
MAAKAVWPLFKPPLRLGQRDLAVRAFQNAGRRYLHAHGIKPENLANGAYGSKTQKDVNRIEHLAGIKPVTGVDVGTATWNAVTPYLSKTDKMYLHRRRVRVYATRVKEAKRLAALEAKEKSATNRFANAIKDVYEDHTRLFYSQVRPFYLDTDRATGLDCSGTVTDVYWAAGWPDPNGLEYSHSQVASYGFTGTLWPRGRYVGSNCTSGDLAFYGYDRRGPYPSHVAVVISEALAAQLGQRQGPGWHVLSFGSNPMSIRLLRYRSDFRGCRRYV